MAAQESPEAEEALEPAISAAEGVIAAAPLIDDLPDDLGEVARALETAASASRLADITRLAEDAGLIARRVELEIYARIEAEEEAQDAADERLAFMLIDEEEKACARTIEKFLRKQQRRRRTV